LDESKEERTNKLNDVFNKKNLVSSVMHLTLTNSKINQVHTYYLHQTKFQLQSDTHFTFYVGMHIKSACVKNC